MWVRRVPALRQRPEGELSRRRLIPRSPPGGLLDESLGVLSPDEHLDLGAEREVGLARFVDDGVDDHCETIGLLPPGFPLRRANAARVARSLVIEHGQLETDGAVRTRAAVGIEQSGDEPRPGDQSLER